MKNLLYLIITFLFCNCSGDKYERISSTERFNKRNGQTEVLTEDGWLNLSKIMKNEEKYDQYKKVLLEKENEALLKQDVDIKIVFEPNQEKDVTVKLWKGKTNSGNPDYSMNIKSGEIKYFESIKRGKYVIEFDNLEESEIKEIDLLKLFYGSVPKGCEYTIISSSSWISVTGHCI